MVNPKIGVPPLPSKENGLNGKIRNECEVTMKKSLCKRPQE